MLSLSTHSHYHSTARSLTWIIGCLLELIRLFLPTSPYSSLGHLRAAAYTRYSTTQASSYERSVSIRELRARESTWSRSRLCSKALHRNDEVDGSAITRAAYLVPYFLCTSRDDTIRGCSGRDDTMADTRLV